MIGPTITRRNRHPSVAMTESPRSREHSPRPREHSAAARAAARVSRASLLLGVLGVCSAIFILAGLLESWRVTPNAASHRISIFGLGLSYPAANAGAIVIIFLAALGSIVVLRVAGGIVHELRASRRFRRLVAAEHPANVHGALLLPDVRPRAFCAGMVRPSVYLTTGALEILDGEALQAVLAHERHHVRRRDPLRLAAGRVMARALFFVPGISELVERQQTLAELSADERAVNFERSDRSANRSALARAMLSFSDHPASAGSAGIDPARVDYLLGESPNWRFPALLSLAAAAAIGLLAAASVLAARFASGSATLAVPFLSRQPCIVILAAIPAVVTALAVVYRRRLRGRLAPSAARSELLAS